MRADGLDVRAIKTRLARTSLVHRTSVEEERARYERDDMLTQQLARRGRRRRAAQLTRPDGIVRPRDQNLACNKPRSIPDYPSALALTGMTDFSRSRRLILR
jgi:hypothetical protein